MYYDDNNNMCDTRGISVDVSSPTSSFIPDPSRLPSALLDTGLAGEVTVGVVGSSHSGTPVVCGARAGTWYIHRTIPTNKKHSVSGCSSLHELH